MKLLRTLVMIAIFTAFAAVLIGLTSAVQQRMNAIRRAERLIDTDVYENVPPVVAFTTVALGGFRGLVADWLWLRSMAMQEEGNYFEMFQLASWIVKLQPRFTGATAFLAWNMAYNISVNFTGFDDRWRWVQAGIQLIRDEGLVYNPGDPELFRELGWIYQHKIGKDLDDANRYYKTEMAKDMIKVLGDSEVDWDSLASSPKSEDELRRVLGEETELWQVLAHSSLTFAALEQQFRENGDFDPEVGAALAEARLKVLVELCLRHRWLLDVYKLDPVRIAALNEEYGSLDWRLPDAHAIYWASRGLEKWETGDDDFKGLSVRRMIFQSLTNAFKGGRLVYLKDAQYLEWTPNVSLVDAVNESYLEAMDVHGEEGVSSGYGNFLIDAVVQLYLFGKEKQAAEYLEKYRDFVAGAKPLPRSVEDFVLRELSEDIDVPSYNQGQSAVQGYLLRACHCLAIGEYDQSAAFELIARKLWHKYDRFIGESTYERRRLPPYENMKREQVERAKAILPEGLAANLEQALRVRETELPSTDEEPGQSQPEDQPE